MNPTAPATQPSLAAQLAQVRVGLREDLDVSRHLFRGKPSYIVRDPVTFQCQQFDPGDYHILTAIDHSRTLGETFDDLVVRGRARRDDEDRFFQFVMDLHRLGFLRLPVSDHKSLYRRHLSKEQAKRRRAWTSFLYTQIPVLNPDAFLNRTIRFARPLFSWPAFILWAVLLGTAIFVAIHNRQSLAQPLEGMLATRNLALMWLTLVVLKVFHEFGHAFACKHFGGHVPEMGVSLIMMTPCAYVDATSSWGFSRRRDRLVVALAGMYIETAIAALAVFVWALTDPSLLHSAAYNVMFLAGSVTVLFNINPLMRFDGYYIMSDLVEVPNLRARSAQYIAACMKKWFLGIESERVIEGRRLRGILFGFGVASFLYRLSLLLAISAVLATKFFIVGVSLAVFYVGRTVATAVAKIIQYLWQAEETAHVRVRAVALGLLLVVGFPAGFLWIPLPARVRAAGVIGQERESVLRAPADVFVEAIAARNDETVHEGAPLLKLRDENLELAVAAAQADVREAEILADAFRLAEPHRAEQEAQRADAARRELERAKERLTQLEVAAPHEGVVIQTLKPEDIGRFLPRGEVLATVADGPWQIRAVLSEEEFTAAGPAIGKRVLVRTTARPDTLLHGEIERIAPMAHRAVPSAALTQLAGGDIHVDPATGVTNRPYFEVVVRLDDPPAGLLRHGMGARVLLHGAPEPFAVQAFRRLHRFLNKLLQE
ncbi:MAG: HlyD family efflux transporter periplasmic adaptor subunit [Phycisphaerae bacterium]|nr:HlyD family efflux transporter periplasmic adaptor subunit [Phycisphaerae bacterium]